MYSCKQMAAKGYHLEIFSYFETTRVLGIEFLEGETMSGNEWVDVMYSNVNARNPSQTVNSN